MTSEDACLTQAQGIVAGKLLTCGICRLAIRTPFNLVNFAPELDSGKRLGGYEPPKNVFEWLEHGVDVKKFMKPFKGSFMGESAEPPTRAFKNHYSCKQLSQFVTETILQRIESGEIRVWGKWVKWNRPTSSFP